MNSQQEQEQEQEEAEACSSSPASFLSLVTTSWAA
eukprot:COSAG01_NODE_1021_length_12074_cov_7.519876_1_plen_35_part_00